jgi:hypothetical protein
MAAVTAPLWAAPTLARAGAAFERGVAIHNMMNWATVEAADPGRYSWPPFVGPNYETPDALLRNLTKAGFDFVRLTIDPGPFLQFTGKKRDLLDRYLATLTERLLAMGLSVIVDFHPNTHVPAYAPEKLVQAIDSPLFAGYIATVRRTAALLASLRSSKVALELMNEPQYGWDRPTTERWQTMLEQLHGAARSEARELPIVLTGARGGDAKGLIAVNPAPFAGSNVLYSFHYYERHIFTHQGVKSSVPNASYWRYVSGLPYPAGSRDPDLVWSGIRDNILFDTSLSSSDKALALRQAQRYVSEYLASGFGRTQIAADFDEVGNWAQRNGIDLHSIFLGEFGVTRTYGMYRASDPKSQEAWMRDVRTEAERRGFRWALWALSGYGGMALVETDGSTRLDPVSLRALGLNEPRA